MWMHKGVENRNFLLVNEMMVGIMVGFKGIIVFLLVSSVLATEKNVEKDGDKIAHAEASANSSAGVFEYYNKNSAKWLEQAFTMGDDYWEGEDDTSEQPAKASDASESTSESGDIKLDTIPLKVGKRISGWGRVSGPEECARTCVPGEQPKICYWKWTVEYYRTLGGACELCRRNANTSITTDCQCTEADGVDTTGIMTVNRMFPGPAIYVCLGDMVVVDVHNKMNGQEVTIHFHGIYQKDYQYYDGVPYVTQCPIPSGTTFRYQWRAQNLGTHWWHSHSGLQEGEGITGPIVIRGLKRDDPNRNLYDRDQVDHVIFLSEWMHETAVDHWPGKANGKDVGQIPDNYLINGAGQWLNTTTGRYTDSNLAVFTVKPGLRYRFRIINAGSWVCPVRLTIQDHDLTVVGSDGEDTRPRVVKTITTFAAERYDFILHAKKNPGTYWIQLRAIGFCQNQNLKLQQHAILQYEGSQLKTPSLARPSYDAGLPIGLELNALNEVCNGSNPNTVCAKNLESADPVDPRILVPHADIQVFLPFHFHSYTVTELFTPGTYNNFFSPVGGPTGTIPLVNDISYRLATSPLLSQSYDVPFSEICHDKVKPRRCRNSPYCQCTHVIKIPLNRTVEIVMADTRPSGLAHPFHLHGFGYHVMGSGSMSTLNITKKNVYNAFQLDRQIYKLRVYDRPPVKDTLACPSNGYTIVRFLADNPGYWYYHCHFLPHLMTGMALVFHVGEPSDLPPVPKGFPKCGNFEPPISWSRHN